MKSTKHYSKIAIVTYVLLQLAIVTLGSLEFGAFYVTYVLIHYVSMLLINSKRNSLVLLYLASAVTLVFAGSLMFGFWPAVIPVMVTFFSFGLGFVVMFIDHVKNRKVSE